MRLTSWNILHGRALKPHQNETESAQFAECVAALGADILALQEVDRFYPRSAKVDLTAVAAKAMGADYWAFAPVFYIYGNGEDSEREPVQPGEILTQDSTWTRGAYGIAIISKLPVHHWERLELTSAKFGKIMNISEGEKSKRFYARDHHRAALAAHYEKYIVINVHLSFVWPFNFLQLMQVKRWAARLHRETGKTIFIVGDFNLSSRVASPKWKSLVTGLSFPIWEPDRQIDYILTNSHISGKKSTLTAFDTSDHLAVSVEIDI